jgi:hypothetical protein
MFWPTHKMGMGTVISLGSEHHIFEIKFEENFCSRLGRGEQGYIKPY